ncbi:MAG TPA: response regulator [Candidatus Nitrosocosmicus sp.]|nr:response regulator [Candidatus Nitrosocosmicus sp.]
MSIKTANTGYETLEYFLDSMKKERPYNAIVLDTHLDNPSGLDVAKRIHSEKPDQKLVLVTTTPREHLPAESLKTAGIKDKDILTIPFKLSKLVTALKTNQLTADLLAN